VIVRSVLALAVIALLVPHAPNLGLGAPQSLPPIEAAPAAQACRTLGGSDASCAAIAADAAPQVRIADLQLLVLARLRAVRADIENSGEAQPTMGGERGRAGSSSASPQSFAGN